MMFTRAQARKSGVAEVEQPADGPFGAAPLVRPTQEAVGKPESSPAGPAGPAPVPATPGVIPTSEDGLGSRPEGFPPRGVFPEMPRRPDRSNSVDRRDAEATQRAGDISTPWVGHWQCWLSNGLVGQRRGRHRLITRHTREALWPHARPHIRVYAPKSRVQQRNRAPHKPQTAAAARVGIRCTGQQYEHCR